MSQATKLAEQNAKPWRVLHACETVAAAAPVAEVQSVVGMHPQLLAREYWNPEAPTELSLLNMWHDVRDWRRALNEAEALTSLQIVHAHSFASAMAGVRGSLPLVYDFVATLEEVAAHQSHGTGGAWLLRSFRVAEQFALSRASAVVTHSTAMKKVAHERGAANENIFVVPEPCAATGMRADRDWAVALGLNLGYHVIVFALPGLQGSERMLRTFAMVAPELKHGTLLLEHDSADRGPLTGVARDLGIADAIRWVSKKERAEAMACADVVIAPSNGENVNSGMLQAMAAGRAIIAADVPENRECSHDGRGCVWFKPEDNLDLAQRLAFVVNNRAFASSLGENGRAHIAAHRGANVVGRQYDEIYRYAHARRNETNTPKAEMPKIYALGMQKL